MLSVLMCCAASVHAGATPSIVLRNTADSGVQMPAAGLGTGCSIGRGVVDSLFFLLFFSLSLSLSCLSRTPSTTRQSAHSTLRLHPPSRRQAVHLEGARICVRVEATRTGRARRLDADLHSVWVIHPRDVGREVQGLPVAVVDPAPHNPQTESCRCKANTSAAYSPVVIRVGGRNADTLPSRDVLHDMTVAQRVHV